MSGWCIVRVFRPVLFQLATLRLFLHGKGNLGHCTTATEICIWSNYSKYTILLLLLNPGRQQSHTKWKQQKLSLLFVFCSLFSWDWRFAAFEIVAYWSCAISRSRLEMSRNSSEMPEAMYIISSKYQLVLDYHFDQGTAVSNIWQLPCFDKILRCNVAGLSRAHIFNSS